MIEITMRIRMGRIEVRHPPPPPFSPAWYSAWYSAEEQKH